MVFEQANKLIADRSLDISAFHVEAGKTLAVHLGVDKVVTKLGAFLGGADSMGCCSLLGLQGPTCNYGCNYCERPTEKFGSTQDLDKDPPRTSARLRAASHLHLGYCPYCECTIVRQAEYDPKDSKNMLQAVPGDKSPRIPRHIERKYMTHTFYFMFVFDS
jgi:hypothetical protein